MENVALKAMPSWKPDCELPQKHRNFQTPAYGMSNVGDLFTRRQLVALTTFSDLAPEVRDKVKGDAMGAGVRNESRDADASGDEASAYADSVAMYLGLAMSRFADRNNSLCTWDSGPTGTKASTGGSARTASIRNLFSRQAIPMVWDFAEANPFSDSGGSFASAFDWIVPAVASLSGGARGRSAIADAATQGLSIDKVVSTDPPYYDNISYAACPISSTSGSVAH